MRIDQFLRDLYPKQILRQTDEEALNWRMATKIIMVPKRKRNPSIKKLI